MCAYAFALNFALEINLQTVKQKFIKTYKIIHKACEDK